MGNVAIGFASRRFCFQSGVWFERVGPNYVVVRPPLGIVVPVLPRAPTTVWVAGTPYYYANDVYYAAAPAGYVVANPPMAADAGSPPCGCSGRCSIRPAGRSTSSASKFELVLLRLGEGLLPKWGQTPFFSFQPSLSSPSRLPP